MEGGPACAGIFDLSLPVLLQSGGLIDISSVPARAGPPVEYVPFVVGGGVILFILAGFVAYRHLQRREEEPVLGASSLGSALGAEQRRKLRRAMSDGRFRDAGELLSEAERWEEAAHNFVRSEAWKRAAECYDRAGEQTQAIHYYKRAGERKRAGKLYAEREDYRAAAAEFAEAGIPELAAKYYAAAGDWERAGRHYAAMGEHREAGNQFELAERPGKAARHYGRAFLNRLDESGGDLSGMKKSEIALAEKASRQFAQAGEFERAEKMLQRAGRAERAVEVFGELEDVGAAAEMLVALGEVEEAVTLLEEEGEEREAFRTRGEYAYESGEYRAAAEAFRKSRDFERSATVYRAALGESKRAGAMYERAERWLEAAEAYERAGENHDAARCAERGGDLAAAARLYRETGETDDEVRVRISQGDFFRAGRLLFERERHEEAIETLERINPRDPIYARSRLLQGDVYRAMGEQQEALDRYVEALDDREPDESTLPVYYRVGRTLERLEKWDEALEYYDAILRVDEGFKDVARRRRTIGRGVGDDGVLDTPLEPPPGPAIDVSAGRSELDAGITESGGAPGVESDLRYEFVEELARGGMGIVYKARDTFLNRIVAVKVLGEDLRDNERAVEYFLREARAVASLAHPNIVTIFDAGEQRGEYYIAMEYVDGETLKETIRREEYFSESETRRILVECCRALQYAHDHDIIHRDVKTDNIMRDPGGSVKVMDFGLAKFLREYKQEHTQQVGTPYYMSPEQIIGEEIDVRADLYGLGCTAFECLTGRVPFTEGELAYHHVHTEPSRPSEVGAEISPQFEQIVMRLLAKKPEERFRSAGVLLEELRSM